MALIVCGGDSRMLEIQGWSVRLRGSREAPQIGDLTGDLEETAEWKVHQFL